MAQSTCDGTVTNDFNKNGWEREGIHKTHQNGRILLIWFWEGERIELNNMQCYPSAWDVPCRNQAKLNKFKSNKTQWVITFFKIIKKQTRQRASKLDSPEFNTQMETDQVDSINHTTNLPVNPRTQGLWSRRQTTWLRTTLLHGGERSEAMSEANQQ